MLTKRTWTWIWETTGGRSGFKPIWPISSNWAPRQKGPALRLLNKANLHFLSKLLVYSAGAGPVFFKVFWEPKLFSIFFRRSLKIQYKFALLPHQCTPKLCLAIISVFRRNNCDLSKRLRSEQGQNLRKLWRGPQYFVSVGSVANEIPSELGGI